MADSNIRVLGLDQAKRNLAELSNQLQNSIVRAAMRAGANVYLKAIRAATYGSGRQRRTGLLVRATGVSTSKKGDVIGAKVRMMDRNVAPRGEDPRRMTAFYWWFLEKGTGQRRTRKGANRGSVSARPYVVPAFTANTDSALDAFREVLNRRLEEAANSMPKGAPK